MDWKDVIAPRSGGKRCHRGRKSISIQAKKHGKRLRSVFSYYIQQPGYNSARCRARSRRPRRAAVAAAPAPRQWQCWGVRLLQGCRSLLAAESARTLECSLSPAALPLLPATAPAFLAKLQAARGSGASDARGLGLPSVAAGARCLLQQLPAVPMASFRLPYCRICQTA